MIAWDFTADTVQAETENPRTRSPRRTGPMPLELD